VQDALEAALAAIAGSPISITAAGRTDRGVHALGQVANFKTPKTIPPGKLRLGINTYLPEDIRVRAAEEVPADFHARYSAVGKRYRYTVLRDAPAAGGGPGGPAAARVLVRRFAAVVPQPLDVEAMRRGARALEGVHDFRAFEASARRKVPAPSDPPRSTVRTVLGVFVREQGPFIFIDAVGRGFLYGMVRAISGTLIEVGARKRRPEEVEAALRSKDRRKAGFTAPPRGLCLMVVYYEREAMVRAVDALSEGRRESDPAAKEHELALKMLVE